MIKLVKNLNTKLYSEHGQLYKIYIGTCTSRNAFGRASKFETETSSLEWEDKANFLFHTSLYFPRFLIISMHYTQRTKNKISHLRKLQQSLRT